MYIFVYKAGCLANKHRCTTNVRNAILFAQPEPTDHFKRETAQCKSVCQSARTASYIVFSTVFPSSIFCEKIKKIVFYKSLPKWNFLTGFWANEISLGSLSIARCNSQMSFIRLNNRKKGID